MESQIGKIHSVRANLLLSYLVLPHGSAIRRGIMSAPVMVKAAALAALLAGVVSCNAPGDGPADTPATPKETQKPKKSWSELIVGKWQFVKTENPPSPPTLSALAE